MKNTLQKFSVYPPIMMLSLYFAVFSYMVPVFMEKFSMSYTQVGTISTVQSLGGMLAQIACFSVFAALNKSRIILISLIAVSVCLIWVGLNQVVILIYVIFFIRGFFGNTGNTLSNALVTDVFDKRKEFFVGLYHALAAGAAVVGPYLALGLGNDITISFGVTAALVGGAAVLFWVGMKDEIKKPLMANKENLGGFGKLTRLFKIRGMVLLMLLIFFCSFAQNTIILYISSFGLGLNGMIQDGAFVLSMFLAGLFVGSLVYSFAAHRFSTIKVMLYFNILAFAALAAMLLCYDAAAVGVLSLAGGVFLGANMPGLFVQLSNKVPHDSGAVSALLFFGGIIACLVAPVLVGAIADAIGMRYALLISMASFFAIIALIVVIRKRSNGYV